MAKKLAAGKTEKTVQIDDSLLQLVEHENVRLRRTRVLGRTIEEGLRLWLASHSATGAQPPDVKDPLHKLSASDREMLRKIIYLIETKEDDKLPTIRVMLRNYKIPVVERSDDKKDEEKATGKGSGHRRSA